MRKLFLGFAAGAMALVGAQTAAAGALTAASITLALGALPPATFTGIFATAAGAGTASGSGATANWSIASGFVPAGATTATIPLTSAPPISQIQVVIAGNPDPGAFVGSAGGAMLVDGVANVKGFGGFTLLGVPLRVGTTLTTTPPTAYGIAITAFANAWTTKTTTIQLQTATQFGGTTSMATGTNSLVGGGGTVTLVSALNVLTNLAGQLPAFVTLTLSYEAIPEPGTLLLLGSGVIGLVAIGRKKIRK